MTKVSTIAWLILFFSSISAAMGAACGAEYVMRRVDAIDAAAQVQRDAHDKAWINVMQEQNKALSDCSAYFGGTVFGAKPAVPEATDGALWGKSK